MNEGPIEGVVHHPTHGRGTVCESRFRGFQLKVRFDKGQVRWVRRSDLRVSSPDVQAGVAPKRTVTDTPRLKYRRMVEAFKLGIVPDEAVHEFTFGRSTEVESIRAWLNDPDRSVLLLVGGYGSGKTHLLEYTSWMALSDGYACAMVELDANEAPLHGPKRVYRRLLQNFRYKNTEGRILGFRDFIGELSSQNSPLYNHKFLGGPLRQARTSGISEAMWNWIEGHESWMTPRLFDHTTCANLYCYLFSALSQGAKSIGLNGLLLLFDEAETLDVGATGYQIERGLNFLRGLSMTCKSAPELDEDVVRHWNAPGSFGARSRLQYSGNYSQIPFILQRPSHLKAIFGFAPSNVLRQTFLADEERLELSNLADDSLREVFQHMCDVYKGAHEFLPDQRVLDRIFSLLEQGLDDSTRMFMKTAIDTMDIRRLTAIGRITRSP